MFCRQGHEAAIACLPPGYVGIEADPTPEGLQSLRKEPRTRSAGLLKHEGVAAQYPLLWGVVRAGDPISE